MWGHVLFPCCGKYLLFFISIVGCKKKFWQQPWIHDGWRKGTCLDLLKKKTCLDKASLKVSKTAVYRVINPKSQIPKKDQTNPSFVCHCQWSNLHSNIQTASCDYKWLWLQVALIISQHCLAKKSSPKAIWSILSKPGRPKSRVGGVSVGDLVWKKAQWWTSDKNIQNETNIAPEKRPSQKETSLPTIHFQGLYSFRDGKSISI